MKYIKLYENFAKEYESKEDFERDLYELMPILQFKLRYKVVTTYPKIARYTISRLDVNVPESITAAEGVFSIRISGDKNFVAYIEMNKIIENKNELAALIIYNLNYDTDKIIELIELNPILYEYLADYGYNMTNIDKRYSYLKNELF